LCPRTLENRLNPDVTGRNLLLIHIIERQRLGAVAALVGIEGGVVSGVINLESSGVEAVGLETTP